VRAAGYHTHGTVGLYDRDRALLEQLGLESMRMVGREWLDLGTAMVADAQVKIEAIAYPAMFFRFTITGLEDRAGTAGIVLKTGSGAIHNYWPIVKTFAENMIWAEPIPRLTPVNPSIMIEP
jgi:hypothetical protein